MAENHTGTPSHLRSPELAVRAFEAEIGFNEALSSFQCDNLPLLAGTDAASFLQAANRAGFSWMIRAAHGDSVELALLHDGGAESAITTTAAGLLPTLLGLLGVISAVHQAAPQPVEPENDAAIPPASAGSQALDVGRATAVAVVESLASVAAKSRADVAARSLAAATNGAVAAVDPDGSAAADEHLAPLSEEQKAAAVAMVGAMSVAQRKAFTIAFRHAFSVPREQVSLAPLITQIQHLEFIDRVTAEAAGGVVA